METIARKDIAHFISTYNGRYERLGKGLKEFTPRLKAQVESGRSILGEKLVYITGYEKTAAVEPYYAEKGSELFDRLQDIIENDTVMDNLYVQVIEVKLWGEHDGNVYPALLEEAYIEVVGYGGDTNGYQIPFVLHFTGKKAKGFFDVKEKTFG